MSAPPSPLDTVSRLSLHSLRVELCRRNLPTTGLRPALERRLSADLAAHRASAPPSPSPPRAPPRPSRGIRKRPRGTISVPRVFACENLPAGLLPRAHVAPRPAPPSLKPPPPPPPARCFRAVLRGRAVWLMGRRHVAAFWRAVGPCGKANLSRSVPSYDAPDDAPDAALKGRAMRQMLAMEDRAKGAERREEGDHVEHVQLTLVEAFYCSFVLNCLVVAGPEGDLVDPQRAWQVFCERAPSFPARFVAYCRYRAVGWLPRSGIKYGVDWVLYPATSKRHSHSPYCVVLQDDTGRKAGSRKVEVGGAKLFDRSWVRLQNRLRLVKNVAKTLVIARISQSEDVDITKSFQTAFKVVKVSEMTVDRWIP